MSELRVISKEEIDKHKSKTDLWVVIHGHVFDVSSWANSHPGGAEVLFDSAKKADAGDDFEDTKHSEDARKVALEYLIGKVEANVKPFPMQSTGKLVAHAANPVTPTYVRDENDNTLLYGGIVAAAVAVGFFLYKRSTA